MIIYKDIITEHELLSDVYDVKDVGDGIWEVDLKMVTVGGEDFKLEGANASAEGEDADEGGDNQSQAVLNVVRDFSLNKVEGLEKKDYQAHIKKYLKAVAASMKAAGKSEDEQKKFQTGAGAAFKKIVAGFKDYDVYTNEAFDDTGMYILVNYREDGVTPFAIYWANGLSEMKV